MLQKGGNHKCRIYKKEMLWTVTCPRCGVITRFGTWIPMLSVAIVHNDLWTTK